MIKVKHLNKAFGSIPVLRDLNLTVNGPLVLMGPSGCGKTTLLRILMGLETPDSGTVQGVGNIGAVFQESRLCPQLTAVGNICLVGGVNPAQAQAELQTLGFTQAELALPVARLSGGQQRRTALLRALLWVSGKNLSVIVSFTHVLPVVYAGTVGGIADTDPALLEMAKVYRLPLGKRLRYIWLPGMFPSFCESCIAAMGM